MMQTSRARGFVVDDAGPMMAGACTSPDGA